MDINLKLRPGRRLKATTERANQVAQRSDDRREDHHPPRLASLIATGGRYADLSAWAKEYGVTETKARQEWHKLGLPVAKGGSA